MGSLQAVVANLSSVWCSSTALSEEHDIARPHQCNSHSKQKSPCWTQLPLNQLKNKTKLVKKTHNNSTFICCISSHIKEENIYQATQEVQLIASTVFFKTAKKSSVILEVNTSYSDIFSQHRENVSSLDQVRQLFSESGCQNTPASLPACSCGPLFSSLDWTEGLHVACTACQIVNICL